MLFSDDCENYSCWCLFALACGDLRFGCNSNNLLFAPCIGLYMVLFVLNTWSSRSVSNSIASAYSKQKHSRKNGNELISNYGVRLNIYIGVIINCIIFLVNHLSLFNATSINYFKLYYTRIHYACPEFRVF
jgi:hypothetical protein